MGLRTLTKVTRKDLKTQVYERLRASLENEGLPVGQIIGASEISSKLQVSRTPAREALLQLQEEGFIEILPSRGIRVLAVTPAYVRSVYEMRAAIEGYAAWRASQDLQDHELDTVKELADLQQTRVGSNDAAWLEGTEGLHRFLVKRLKNDLLFKQFTQLLSHHARVRRLAARLRFRRHLAVEEHCAITEALLRRDAMAAHDAMVKHLMSVASDVIRAKADKDVTNP